MAIEVKFHIWIASKSRWAHLTKLVGVPAVPRVGEFVKFRNAELGDYFAWQISEITFREESGLFEISTELLDNIDDRGYSFETEEEFDEYLSSYLEEGWACPHGVTANRHSAEPN